MKKKQYKIWTKEEYIHPNTFGFVPNIMSYLHEDEIRRPCILVVPGGAYASVSPTEGEIVAKRFYERGCQSFVLTYTINRLMGTAIGLQALRDISRALRYLRKNSAKFKLDEQRVAVCGFSAGAHVCASLCVHFKDIGDYKYKEISNRPDAAILSYPVITSGEFAHKDSFRNLLGRDIYLNPSETYEGIPFCETRKAALEYMSLEKWVSKDTAPCFIWHTVTDKLVPAENTVLFAKALKKAGVSFACHLFSTGEHGLSLADETWGRGEFGEDYTHEQTKRLFMAIKEGKMKLCEADKREYAAFLKYQSEHPVWIKNHGNREVAQWFELAVEWLGDRKFK